MPANKNTNSVSEQPSVPASASSSDSSPTQISTHNTHTPSSPAPHPKEHSPTSPTRNEKRRSSEDLEEEGSLCGKSAGWLRLFPYVIGTVLLGLVVWVGRELASKGPHELFLQAAHIVGHVTWEDMAIATLLLALAVVCCLPVMIFEVTVGFVFGWWGYLISWCAIVLGSVLSFWLGRSPPLLPVRKYLAKNRHVKLFVGAISRDELKFLLLVRFAYMPISLKNYGFSVIDVSFWNFALATGIAAAINCPVFTYAGVMAREFLDLDPQGHVHPHSVSTAQMATLALGLVCFFSFSYYAYTAFQKEAALQEAADREAEKKTS
eukprot:GDKI01001305.1.p1 GENE.GDKI01001305.1~~GDKI01001305.1.p1  ORF type:complete len:321 (-),score=46.85 GDKI01001305.1:37-999(-)